MSEFEMALKRFREECDEMIIRNRRQQQLDEEFRGMMLQMFNSLNGIVTRLLEQVDILIKDTAESTINSIAIENKLKSLGAASEAVIEKCNEVQSSMSDNYQIQKPITEKELLCNMIGIANDAVGKLVRMVGNLTASCANAILEEKALRDKLSEIDPNVR